MSEERAGSWAGGSSGSLCSDDGDEGPVLLPVEPADPLGLPGAPGQAADLPAPRPVLGPPGRVLNEPYVVGIDEAGRGPVCGPLVYGIAYAPLSLVESGEISRAGANDSKKLSARDREEVMQRLDRLRDKGFGYAAEVISARRISEAMLRPRRTSLNVLSYEAAASLLAAVVARHDVREAFVDLITPESAYRAYLERAAPRTRILIKEKADATYPITGAASIVAKTIRDSFISPDWGSGYPSDPGTRRHLEACMDRVFGFPDHVRHSWATVSKLYQAQRPPCRFFSELEG